MSWDLTRIRAKTRKLSGRLSTSQLSVDDLDLEINCFYQEELPKLLGVSEFDGWWAFDTEADDIGRYKIDEAPGVLKPPFTVDNDPLTIYYDPNTFFDLWPRSETYEANQPYDGLIFAREIWLRPPPDATYTFKAAVSMSKPDALNLNSNPSPLDIDWGPLIAYGTAANIKNDNGEDATNLENKRDYYATLEGRQEIARMGQKRSKPRF